MAEETRVNESDYNADKGLTSNWSRVGEEYKVADCDTSNSGEKKTAEWE